MVSVPVTVIMGQAAMPLMDSIDRTWAGGEVRRALGKHLEDAIDDTQFYGFEKALWTLRIVTLQGLSGVS